MTGKQRVEEILQKYSNAVVDEAVEKCVGGGIVVFAERAKAKRLEALDSIEEVMVETATMGAKFGNASFRQYNIANPGKPINLDETLRMGIEQATRWVKGEL